MSRVHFDKFGSGLDRRKSRDTSGADALYELKNAYITTGKEIAKRPCAVSQVTLENGTVGLWPALGVLNTFTHDRSIVHGDPLFVARFVPHATDSSRTVAKIHWASTYAGFIYVVVEYDNGNVQHHYLDAGSAVNVTNPKYATPTWVASAAYATTSPHFVSPTVPNGFRYQCTTGGTSAGSEPVWPTTLGATVADNTVVWTCRSFVVVDSNCPQSKSVAEVGEKLYAINGETVRYNATAVARDWSSASDAGFLSVGSQQQGSTTALAVAEFKDQLAVFFADGLQVWDTDPDPALTVIRDKVFNTGCRFRRSPAQVSQDTVFLSDNGYRSVALATQLEVVEDTDVGAPIDSIVRPLINDSIEPITSWFAPAGQYLSFIAEDAFAYTYSRTGKVAAWSQYRFPWAADDVAVFNGKLYLRDGNSVYRLDENTHQDGMEAPEVIIEFPFLDFQEPGVLKLIQGVDFQGQGSANISFKYRVVDQNGNLQEHSTDEVTLTSNSMPGTMTPVELCVTAIAPRIRHQSNEAFRLSRLTMYYQLLGVQ